MKKIKNFRINNEAVSSVISLLLVMMIFFSASGMILIWGPQYIKTEGNKNENKSIVNQFKITDKGLGNLVGDGNGSSFTSKITVNGGSIGIDDSDDEGLIILYSTDKDKDWDFNVTLDGNQFSISGPDVHSATVYWLDDTCFLAGTKIAMANGSQKNIEDIRAGDVVKSYDEVSKDFVDACVKALLSYSTDRMSDYYLVINNELRVTPNHRLFVDNMWVEAGMLSVGDVLFDAASEEKISLFSIEKSFSKERSFDLILESGNVYFADGFLAKSDVEAVVVSGSVGVRKMSCAPIKLKPLGGPVDPPASNPNPLDGAIDVDLDADLIWTCSNPDVPLSYDVYFGIDPTPDDSELVSTGQSGTSYNPGAMAIVETYYWQIVVTDHSGDSTTGPVWHFKTEGFGSNTYPNLPSNPDPEDGETDVDLNYDLSWDGGDSDSGDTVTYDVYFGLDTRSGPESPDPPYYDTIGPFDYDDTPISYNLPKFNYNTLYFWKIVAEDDHGASTPGPVWDFETLEEEEEEESSGRIFNPSQDCYISRFAPTSTNGCMEEWLRVDPGPSGYKNRALLKFSLYQIPSDAFIEKAELNLYYYRFLEDNPAGDVVFANEVNDYPWQGSDTSWRYWDTSGVQQWPLLGAYRVHMRRGPEYPNVDTIAEATLPSSFGWVTWGDSSPFHGGMGMTQSTIDMWDGTRINYGWLITGYESGGKTDHFDFYSRRVPLLFPSVRPKLIVNYVAPPVVTTTPPPEEDVRTTTATLSGYLDNSGLIYALDATRSDGTACYVTCAVANCGGECPIPIVEHAEDRSTAGPFSAEVTGLNSGSLYLASTEAVSPKAGNGVPIDQGEPEPFFTVPLPPSNLDKNDGGSGPNQICLTWDKPLCGTSDDNVYTRVLAKIGSYPSDQDDSSASVWYSSVPPYYGTASTYTKTGLPSGTTYKIRAWTYAEEELGSTGEYYGRWSTDYAELTASTSGSSNNPPTALFDWNDIDGGDPGAEIFFNASDSDDSDGWITSWDWDFHYTPPIFNFNVEGSGETIVYNYTDYNTHTCMLRVTDNDGASIFISHVVQAVGPGDNPPTALFDWNDIDGGDPGAEIFFDASDSDDDIGISEYAWDFDYSGSFTADDYGMLVSYNYTDYNTHTCMLRVTDNHVPVGQTSFYDDDVYAFVSAGGTPTIPNAFTAVGVDDPAKYYIGVDGTILYNFSVRSVDSEGDNIYYEFDWGDGSSYYETGFSYPANMSIEECGGPYPSHYWTSPGTYEIRVRARDDGATSDWSDPIAIRLSYQYIVPPDKKYEDLRIAPDSGNTFTANKELTGTFCIYLFNDNYPSEYDPAVDKIPFGKIYGLKTGRIVTDGGHKTILQNGGVLSVLSGDARVDSCSYSNNIVENGNILGFTATMIRGDTTIAGSGAGATHEISFKNLNTFTREQGLLDEQNCNAYGLKIKYSGEYSSYWHEYLTRTYKFDYQSDSDFLAYDDYNGKQLVFKTALIKANLE